MDDRKFFTSRRCVNFSLIFSPFPLLCKIIILPEFPLLNAIILSFEYSITSHSSMSKKINAKSQNKHLRLRFRICVTILCKTSNIIEWTSLKRVLCHYRWFIKLTFAKVRLTRSEIMKSDQSSEKDNMAMNIERLCSLRDHTRSNRGIILLVDLNFRVRWS